ncbi:short-chain dehydrogenase, putative [Talaromyces stipitatus ATCC 10500]|uniref:Short-chain dehydrogenase, putative n=1 Tax=Talaromyces stipitatus (strain ATCC 10500 / CBS 375.48 / QM 6759 / NRRL 1006) TaxID=441959 RepID=B8MAG8_TALSN|nr:short-chain dehydrogenase, putative [Talaromyces stipitatus ATCC 10500]EED17392.1 short-chain dehydrogenase, putative [Talaromyces stipitatus ATCC 10500]
MAYNVCAALEYFHATAFKGCICELLIIPETATSLTVQTITYAKNPRLKELTEEYPGRVIFVPLTVGDEASMRNAVPVVESALKDKGLNGLDVLINTAGIMGAAHAEEMSDLDDVFHVNDTGPHMMILIFLPLLRNGNEKKVINCRFIYV